MNAKVSLSLAAALSSARDRNQMRIEVDDLSRPQVLSLLAEHLRNMMRLVPSAN